MKFKPILHMRGVSRTFVVGDQKLTVLKKVNLTIHSGTMVAIMGSSGSGKSTLLNILGCLDHPSSGSYKVWGREAKSMSSDALASVRRKFFGFVFQRYHLLPGLTAQGNVEVPAVYAAMPSEERSERAQNLLTRLGLGDRLSHMSHQLSGGQQQRVSVARALMNGGQVIFADEPTGALDRESGLEMLRLLVELHALGHTVILVTHDASVAAYAERIIELSDGKIVSDRANIRPPLPPPVTHSSEFKVGSLPRTRSRASKVGLMKEAFRMARHALLTNRFRTLLTLLGIVIGIASLVSIIAIGEGGQRRVREILGSLANNTIEVHRGTSWGDNNAPSIHTLVPHDLEALKDQAYIDSATPITKQNFLIRYESLDSTAMVTGAAESFFKTRSIVVAEGRAFSADEVRQQSQVAVIDQATKRKFFGNGPSPLGQIIIVGTVPCTVIGVTTLRSQDFYPDPGLNLVVPYTTAGTRLFGYQYLDSISVKVRDGQSTTLAEQNIKTVLFRTHGEMDFFTYNRASMAKDFENTKRSLSVMLSVIASISLVVGGIGVMNIMLVSVTERTREIGIRMAVGARQSDIMKQFLVEGIVVCLIGAAVGMALALAIGVLFSYFVQEWQMVFTPNAVFSALASSTLIGILFGYLPARKASRLNPVDALVRD